MAAKRITYIGGAATRAPGTIASFIHQGANFAGCEIVLYDIEAERLALVLKLARKMAADASRHSFLRHVRSRCSTYRQRLCADQLSSWQF